MPYAESRDDYRGRWVSIMEAGVPIVSAHQAEGRRPGPVTVYWAGRTDAEGLEEFFFPALPDSTKAVSALLFTHKERFRLDLIQDREELRRKIPSGTVFLRLEGQCETSGDDRTVLEPAFIVWSRLNLPHVDRPAPDKIGVFLTLRHMSQLDDRLTDFVARTRVDGAPLDLIAASLRLLSRELITSGLPA